MDRENIIALFKTQNWYSLYERRFKEHNSRDFNGFLLSCPVEEYINWAFTWDYTPEGRKYWDEVDFTWRRIAENKE